MTASEALQSKTIAFLRFPLIVGVVLIHSTLGDVVINGVRMADAADFPLYDNFSYLFSQIFARIAVPLFFFISGYLFFFKTDGFSGQTYVAKMKKRARSILVPYLCWNLLIIVFRLVCEQLAPGLFSGRNKPVADYGWSDWLWAFWDTGHINPDAEGCMPINYPFWFIRDLMVVMVLSPLVYWVVRSLRHYSVLVLGVLWLAGWWFSVIGFSLDAFFFFSAGAYFGIFKKSFVDAVRGRAILLGIVYAVLAVAELCFREAEWIGYVHKLGILVGMAFAVALCAHFLAQGRWQASRFLSDGSFFVYAYHAMPLAFVIKLCFKLIHPQTDGALLFLYLFCPAVIILVGLGLYYGSKKYLPRFTAVITGGR